MRFDCIVLPGFALLLTTAALGQQTGGTSNTTLATQLPLSGRTGQSSGVTVQQAPVAGTTQSVDTINSTVLIAPPYSESVLSGKPVEGKLSLREAIRRGIVYNLGAIGLNNGVTQAHGQLRVARSVLLPNLNGYLREAAQQTDLAAEGLRVPFIPRIVGPYNYFDLRATLTQTVADATAFNNYRTNEENVKAAQAATRDARDLVVLGVGGAYLQVIAAQARVNSAIAQVATSKALYEQTQQFRKTGLSAQIDENRSQVEYQTQLQRLTTLKNDLAKQKINLSRIIGLPATAEYELADDVPFSPAPPITFDQAVQSAMKKRADLQSAEAAFHAAQHAYNAAKDERLPSIVVAADYGAIGINPAQSHGTFDVSGTLRIPIWQGGRTEGDIEQSVAALRQREAEVSELHGRIVSDVRNAFLDLEAATSQLQVAESNQKVASENLVLTRQRLEAGIAQSVEVTQALETVATSDLDYITSLFAHNLAKLSLARAIGNPEEVLSQYLAVP